MAVGFKAIFVAGIMCALWPGTAGTSDEHQFRAALPGYQYRFPLDLGSHDDFQTEWWYYTGHLRTAGNWTYGYELTFFRRGIASRTARENPSRWNLRNIYFAHFAITDEGRDRFYFAEKVSRAGIGKAGAERGTLNVWIDNWHTEAEGNAHHLHAEDHGFALDVTVVPEKPPVVHGRGGISRKGDAAGAASHYYSFTRLKTEGTLSIDSQVLPVVGMSWMDHEFSSNQLEEDQVGWDWFSLQFEDRNELMLYLIRRRDGSVEPASGGTWISSDGASLPLTRDDIHVEVLEQWHSPKSGATYPGRWHISVPSLALSAEVAPTVRHQELITAGSTAVTYWEGSAIVKGERAGHPVAGLAYVELTGYASALHRRF